MTKRAGIRLEDIDNAWPFLFIFELQAFLMKDRAFSIQLSTEQFQDGLP
jgi:hypothetical protein